MVDVFHDKNLMSPEKEVFYKVIFSRRDVRKRFIDKTIDNKTIHTILKAAHHAPSVGFSRPWNFILIKIKYTSD